jgi:histidinol-phosphate aminotransferase
MIRYWSNKIKNINPYTPWEQRKDGKYIKLNTKENPYPLSSRIIESIKNKADQTLRLYPDQGVFAPSLSRFNLGAFTSQYQLFTPL